MSDWRIEDDRRTATRNFCAFLHNPANAQDRNDCTIRTENAHNPFPVYAKAKEVFAREGGFTIEEDFPPGRAPEEAIPAAVEFRVYEERERFPRDNLVTLVLPRPDMPLPTGPSFKVSKYYRCTWTPWRSRLLSSTKKR